MRVLIACESSGSTRDAFSRAGHDAWSCDLLPSETPGNHIIGDVLGAWISRFHGGLGSEFFPTKLLDQGWDLMIAHPDCTYLTCSAEWAYKDVQTKNIKPGTLIGAERRAARDKAVDFFMALANANIPRIAIENPVGVMSSRWRKADQYIQPYDFGEDASKRTGLWLKNLPKLTLTERVQGRMVVDPRTGKTVERWANQTDSGQNKLGPSEDRWKDRARTYAGISAAFADQWGNL